MTTGRTLSPRDLARVIGSSESSLKRWADEGRIRVFRTAGGHRRITLDEAVRFIRETGAPIVDPAALGVGDLGELADAETHERLDLHDLLLRGDGAAARGLINGAYLRGASLYELFDGSVSEALRRLGELWKNDPSGVFLEHRATEICLHALHQVRAMLPVFADGPVAVGGGTARDPYALPTLMAAMVLQVEGWRTINLGPDSPATVLLEAARRHEARLVWLSVTSSEITEDQFARELHALVSRLESSSVRLAIGGRRRDLLDQVPADRAFVGHTMGELVAFARGLRAAGDL